MPVWKKKEITKTERSVEYTTIDVEGNLQELYEIEVTETEVCTRFCDFIILDSMYDVLVFSNICDFLSSRMNDGDGGWGDVLFYLIFVSSIICYCSLFDIRMMGCGGVGCGGERRGEESEG